MKARRPVFGRKGISSKGEVSEAYDRLYKNGYSSVPDGAREEYDRLRSREGTKDQVAAWRQIAEGNGTFRYRCGGLRGPVHRIRISPRGEVSFPDHSGDGEVSEVLGALAGERTAPTCADVRSALADPGPDGENSVRSGRIKHLWPGTLSDMPGWGQALLEAVQRREKRHNERRAERAKRDPVEPLRNAAAIEIANDAGALRQLGVRAVEWHSDTRGLWDDYSHGTSGVPAVSLPWSDGYAAWMYTRLSVRHGTHRDFCPVVRSAPDARPFDEPTRLLAFVVCSAGRESRLDGTTIPALIERRGPGRSSWEVVSE